MTTNLHDKMLAAIDAYFSSSGAVEEEVAENLLLDVRDEINKHKLAEQPAQPLTDEQIFEIKHNWITTPFANHLDFARAIEAAHGITKGGA